MTSLLQAIVRVADSRTSDAELLARFVASRDERAFEELVRRHGPLVWSICRHLLTHHADAEDAFQAVFLALVRSAGSIRDGRALPAWLHGVAVRVAEKAKRSAVRRRQREQRAAVPEADRPVPDESWAALMTAVHEEIRKLPEAERLAFVLCDLEGVRQPDAAKRLGWPLGTLWGRLCKARQQLLDQLTRRGIAPAVLAVGGVAGTAGSVPALLFNQVLSFSTAGAVGVSSTVVQLARGLVEGATMRTKVLAATLLAAGAIGMTGGAMVLSKADAQDPNVVQEVRDVFAGGGQAQPPAAGGGGRVDGFGQGANTAGGFTGSIDLGRSATSGGPQKWEYRFAMKPKTVEQFVRLLSSCGDLGWEFVGATDYTGINGRSIGKPNLIGDENSETIWMLIFKRPKGNARTGGGMSGPGAGMSMGGYLGGTLAGGFGLPPGPSPGGLGGLMGGNRNDVVQAYRLKNTAASVVAAAIEKSPAFKNKGLKVTFDTGSNTITFVVDPAAINELTKVIKDLDANANSVLPGPGGASGSSTGGGGVRGGGSSGFSPSPPGGLLGGGGAQPGGAVPGGGTLTVISLKFAKAEDMVPVLIQVFPAAQITPDGRTNVIIVRADEKTKLELEALIQRLDVEGKKR